MPLGSGEPFVTKSDIREVRALLFSAIIRLEEMAPGLDQLKLKDDAGYIETGKAVIEAWSPRGRFMLKQLDRMIEALPKEKRGRKPKND